MNHKELDAWKKSIESCERIGFAELTGSFGSAELRNSFPRSLLRG